MKTVLFAFLLSSFVAQAIPPVPPSYFDMAKAPKGVALRREDAPSPEGGGVIAFEILKKKSVLKRFIVSDTQFDAHATSGDPHGEKITVEECRSQLKELSAELKKRKFKKVLVSPDACAGNRRDTVSLK